MLEPYASRVLDPRCGSGGMFVQSEKFITEHRGKVNDISIYGQESNQTTWRLEKMNLAFRGIDSSQVKWNNEGSFLNDAHKDLKADYVIANPPFNDSDGSGEQLRKDARWQFGAPPSGNALRNSIDYNKDAKTTRLFFAKVQNKLHFGIHGRTAAELIYERADSRKKNMASSKGMRTQRIVTENGDSVHIYSNHEEIVLQLRHQPPTETDLLFPSFKVAIALSDDEILAIAGELITASSLGKKAKTPK